MLMLPLTVVLVFSFGERAPAGGVVLAFTFEQYANLPARWTAFKNTMTLAPIGTLAALLIAYPLAYFLAVKVDAKVENHPAGAGDRAVLDLDPDPQLCLDLSCWAGAALPALAGLGRDRRRAPDQYALSRC